MVKKGFKYIKDQRNPWRNPAVKFADAEQTEEKLEDIFDHTNLDESSDDETDYDWKRGGKDTQRAIEGF